MPHKLALRHFVLPALLARHYATGQQARPTASYRRRMLTTGRADAARALSGAL